MGALTSDVIAFTLIMFGFALKADAIQRANKKLVSPSTRRD